MVTINKFLVVYMMSLKMFKYEQVPASDLQFAGCFTTSNNFQCNDL